METGLYIFLGLVVAYVLFVFWLVQTKKLEKWNLSLLLGIILMVRTQKGKGVIDFIARPRRFWNFMGDFGIGLTLVGMLVITLFFLLSVWLVIQPGSDVPALGPAEIFVIPGVTPFVPLWYGIIALIVTLIVHEGGHGVLARANGMKLKSIGVLVAIVPIGAFVEPDDLDMKVASRRQRLRVFGAGPGVNFAFAAIALMGFAALMGSLAPTQGMHVASVSEGRPADIAGLSPGDTVVGIDGTPIYTYADYLVFLNGTRPGQHVALHLNTGQSLNATAMAQYDRYNVADQNHITNNDTVGQDICRFHFGPDAPLGKACSIRLTNTAFLGIAPFEDANVAFLHDPFVDRGTGFLNLFAMPIGEFRGQPILSVYMPAFETPPFNPALFWPMANLLFWIFWINFAVGLTNILPMMPLDGGHIFADAVGGLIQKLRPHLAPEPRERLIRKTAGAVSLVILAAFLLMIFAPHLRNLLQK